MMKLEKISVIVPIYNVEKYLKRCIDSILIQTYKNLEIILIDDGSPDNCGTICDEFAKVDKRIKVIHQSNKGLAETRNVGIIEASADLIIFIDSDDYINENMVKKLYEIMKQGNAEIAACGHLEIYDNGIKERNCPEDINIILTPEEALSIFLFTKIIDVISWNKLYYKDLFKEIKFPTGKLYEDHYTIYKVIDKAKRIAYDSTPLYYYCKRSNSIGGSAFSVRTLELRDALDEECSYIISKYPNIKNNIRLAKGVWLMVVYNKMLLSKYDDKEFVRYLKTEILASSPGFLINHNLTFIKRMQLLIFLVNKKLYAICYKKFISKNRGIES